MQTGQTRQTRQNRQTKQNESTQNDLNNLNNLNDPNVHNEENTADNIAPLRIGIDGRYIYDHFPGIGRYVANLVAALATLDHPHTIVLFTNSSLPNTRHNYHSLLSHPTIEHHDLAIAPFSLEEQWKIPQLARSLNLDVLHSPFYIKPYVGLPCPSVVTIYDLIGRKFPHLLPSKKNLLLFRLTMWFAIHRSSHIITISKSAKHDILAYYNVPPEQVTVTPLATDSHFVPPTDEVMARTRATYHLPRRYILYLGANKPHKNLVRLLEAWEQVIETRLRKLQSAEHPSELPILIIAGHHDSRYPEACTFVTEHKLGPWVRFLWNVNDDDLPALYGGALFFAFPSYYEGFGLPPLEAMACGTPVLCGSESSLPEVVGDAAEMVDPHRTDLLAAGLERLLFSDGYRATLRARGLQRVRDFSWWRTAQETLAVYEAAVRDATIAAHSPRS